ncbi:unnamed protein product [Effrenium voratum]|nr:unnamed protein product [Effrenium voratum]
MLKELPYFADGRLLFKAMRKFVDEVFEIVDICSEDGTAMPAIDKLKNAIMNETLEAHSP